MAVFLKGEARSTSSTRSWISSTVGTSPRTTVWARLSTRRVNQRAISSEYSSVARPAFSRAVVILLESKGTTLPSLLRMVTNPVADGSIG